MKRVSEQMAFADAGTNRFGFWTIRFVPTRDRYGHQHGDVQEFQTLAARDAAFAAIVADLAAQAALCQQ